MIDIDRLRERLFEILEEKDVKHGFLDVETYLDVNTGGQLIRGTFQPYPKQYYFVFRALDDDLSDDTEIIAERTAFQIEQTLHPERIERQMLEAAMEVINSERPNGNSKEDDKVSV